MTDGPIYRSPGEVAEYLATHRTRIGASARIIPGNSVRARLTAVQQDRIDRYIAGEAGVYELEELRGLRGGEA